MERPSSKRSRDERDSTREHRDHRDREGKNHRSRGDGDGGEKRSSRDEKHRHHRSDRDSRRESSHEPRDHKSRRDDDREQRERSEPRGEREREVKRERESEREGSVEKKQKRKDRGESEDRADGGEKRSRVSDDRKESTGNQRRERRRFGDKVKEEADVVGVAEENAKPVNPGEVKVKKEETDEQFGNGQSSGATNGGRSGENVIGLESISMAPRSVPESSPATGHPFPTKVSSIPTTHENKGVSITRSHEVPGKSSTDGTSSAAGKTTNLSLDALAKAKKALQMQKELKEKLKKIPQLNKNAGTSNYGRPPLGLKAPPSAGTLPTARTEAAGSISSTLPTTVPASMNTPLGGTSASTGLAGIPNIEAVKRAQELAARMGFRQDPEFAPLINLFPGQVATADVTIPQKPTKAPVLRLDALGREIDEHGNVVNVAKPSNLSTLKVNINKQKKDAFQILNPEFDMDPESNPYFDPKMGINKTKLLRPKRMSFQFVEEGKWSKEAESLKLKSQFGEAQAKEFRVKQAQLAKAKAAPDINPNLIVVAERILTSKEKPKDPIPEIEWWDVPLLISGSYGDIAEGMVLETKLKMEKVTIYVEHPRPIEPPAEPAPPPPQPLKLTKPEQKKLRTQRRLAREKDRQEMIRQGLLEPPKPKVKMSNLMKVLGAEATQDPTKLEREVQTAAAEREQAHVDRNIARMLTPSERREKKERKLFDDPNTLETIVSVYKINDLSHPSTRFKVDVNAQENRLTGCAVIADGITVVVVEGGSKSIKRYGKLMLRRINWASAVNDEDGEGDEDEEKPVNKCVLVWQGSIARPSFNRFFVHECRTEAAAKKVFSDAGVVHYWDLAVNFSDDQM